MMNTSPTTAALPSTTANADAGKTRRDLVQDHLSLVEAISVKYLKKYNLLIDSNVEQFKSDVIHAGIIGLHRATEKYNPSRGKFSSYAWPWIAKYVRQALADIFEHRRKTSSLDVPARRDEEDGESLLDTLPDAGATPVPEIVARHERHERLWEVLAKLPARERLIIERRFGLLDDDPRPFREIGQELDVAPQRVHFLLQKTLQTLRHELRPVA